jgi:hypothetical protein
LTSPSVMVPAPSLVLVSALRRLFLQSCHTLSVSIDRSLARSLASVSSTFKRRIQKLPSKNIFDFVEWLCVMLHVKPGAIHRINVEESATRALMRHWGDGREGHVYTGALDLLKPHSGIVWSTRRFAGLLHGKEASIEQLPSSQQPTEDHASAELPRGEKTTGSTRSGLAFSRHGLPRITLAFRNQPISSKERLCQALRAERFQIVVVGQGHYLQGRHDDWCGGFIEATFRHSHKVWHPGRFPGLPA